MITPTPKGIQIREVGTSLIITKRWRNKEAYWILFATFILMAIVLYSFLDIIEDTIGIIAISVYIALVAAGIIGLISLLINRTVIIVGEKKTMLVFYFAILT